MILDIETWLHGIGLGQYAATFRSNEIDASLLRGLSGDDLKEMGIAALGHRKKLLEAIALLDAAPDVGASTPAAADAPTPASTAERRHLTVMFCDLVGSTALSGRLDPEDLQQLIRSYHDAVAAAVAPYAGHIAQFLGDGVLVYFGYPQAHEDDAARAVRSALSIVKALETQRFHGDTELQTRIGIATGRVVIGEIGAGTAAAERSASGETPNLAARLQAQAKPGEIVLADDTRKLLGESFALESLGRLELKGFAAPERGVARARRAHRSDALRGPAHARPGRVHRPRQRGRAAAGALGAGARRRRPGRAAVGRGRHRQVTRLPDLARSPGRRSGGYRVAPVFALLQQQRAVPGCAASGAHRRHGAGRFARGPRREARTPGRRTATSLSGLPAAADGLARWRPVQARRRLAAGRKGPHARGAARVAAALVRAATGAVPGRRRALDRCEHRRVHRASGPARARYARAVAGDLPVRVHALVEQRVATDPPQPKPALQQTMRGARECAHRGQGAAGRGAGRDHPQDRRHSAVRRGVDQDRAAVGLAAKTRRRAYQATNCAARYRRWRFPPPCRTR